MLNKFFVVLGRILLAAIATVVLNLGSALDHAASERNRAEYRY